MGIGSGDGGLPAGWRERVAGTANDPRRLDDPGREMKYWMMRRPAEFPDLGKTYNVEWIQFQGTAPMTQALAAGALDCATQAPLSLANGVVGGNLKAYIVAQHVFEKPGGFSVYWAVKDNSPIKKIADLKGKTVGISVIGGGTYGPFAMLLKKNGVDPEKDIKLVEVGFAVSEDALRQGRVDAVNIDQPFAAHAEAKGGTRKLFSLSEEMPNIVHILEACRADFVDKNPDLVRAYVRDITLGMKKALANRDETLKVVSEVLKAPIPVLDTYLLKDNDFRQGSRRGAEIRGHPEDARHLSSGGDAAEDGRRAVQAPNHRGAAAIGRSVIPGRACWRERRPSFRGAMRSDRSRTRVTGSCLCDERSNPSCHRGGMDCFVASAPRNDGIPRIAGAERHPMKKWRSRVTTDGLDRAPHRAFMRAMGLDDAAIASR